MTVAWRPWATVSLTTTDTSGETGVTEYRYLSTGAIGGQTVTDLYNLAINIATLQQALQTGVVSDYRVILEGYDVGVPMGGTYQQIDVSARTLWRTDDKRSKRLSFNTPALAIFLADQETLDTENTDVAAWAEKVLVSTVDANNWKGCTDNGVTLNRITSGQMVWKNRESGGRPS